MKTDTLRTKFIEFFKRKGHVVFPSDTLVPDDPTVLFTSAGMNQFKPYFLGEKKDVKRAVSFQKCLRTGDLGKVGHTAYHHTFFEMLGNFSFGDYFKKETIEFGWEFLTQELNMNPDDLWVSVYTDDHQAYALWNKHIGVPSRKIVKLGQESNFWPAHAPLHGPNGPCGPCSEIFFDRGEKTGCGRAECDPSCECGRFIEIWNLVFTQFNRVGKNKLEPLPQKNIDTGMGLERMAAVLQGKSSNFEIDILAPVVLQVQKLLPQGREEPQTRSLINAIVDHARAATFAIADGVYPSNEERGYVVRKIIRKALWSAHLLGKRQPFIHLLSPLFAELMKKPYPEVDIKNEIIAKVIKAEEEKFLSTLKEGKEQLLVTVKELKKKNQHTIGADDLFRLYDTYGFPLELSKETASHYALEVDEAGFKTLLKKQQERSRKQSMFDEDIFKKGGVFIKKESKFIGYEHLEVKGKLLQLLPVQGREDTGKGDADELSDKEEGVVISDITPFYAEAGGQLTDKGIIQTEEGIFSVEKVFEAGGAILHKGKVLKGAIRKGKAKLIVDKNRRKALARAHTATHLLQAALRQVLGEHITQQGSLVDEDRLRFDFTHFAALTSQEMMKVEEFVNDYILRSDEVYKDYVSYDAAKKQGALAFFKDKYGKKVRMVSVSDYSKELCGGTHLSNTAEVGSFAILSESSISSGVRRIEAVVGRRAYQHFKEMERLINETKSNLKTDSMGIPDSLAKVLRDSKKKDDTIEELEMQLLATKIHDIIAGVKTAKETKYLVYSLKDKDYPSLMKLSDMIKERLQSVLVFLISHNQDKDIFVCAVTDDLMRQGVSAKQFIAQFKESLSLRGGGRDTLTQGIFVNKAPVSAERLEEAIAKFLSP